MANTNKVIQRPPRIQPELPIDEIEIPAPPDESAGQQSIFELFLPLIMVIGYIFLAFSGGGRSIFFVLPMGVAMLFSVVFGVRRFLQAQRIAEEEKIAYQQRLADMRYDMEFYHQKQQDFYYYNYPDPETITEIVNMRMQSRTGPRIWERRTQDFDFGVIRLGIGTIESSVKYVLREADGIQSSVLLDDALRLSEDSKFVTNVPVTISLRQPKEADEDEDAENESALHYIVPTVRTSLGIYPDHASFKNKLQTDLKETHQSTRETVYDYINSLLMQFLTFHSYTDSELYLVASDRAQTRWEWLSQVPHVKISEQTNRMCFIGRNESSDMENTAISIFWKNLRSTLLTRQQRLNEAGENVVEMEFMLIVIDMQNVASNSVLANIENEPTISLILEKGRELNVAVIFLVDHPDQIVSYCEAVIELQMVQSADNPHDYNITFRYAEIDVNTPRFVGYADLVEPVSTQLFTDKLKDYEIRLSAATALTTSLNLLDLYKATQISELDILANWRTSRDVGEWPRVPIGKQAGNVLSEIVFDAKISGVHGMIAGTTGSGKTELLKTIIVGLAIKYDPSAVNFLLVDFKGGAGFDEFSELPHCIELVTNLVSSAVERVFASIKSELDRRSAIIAEADRVDHIVDYRRAGLHRENPLPHLFIIIDEFAEMIQENADFKAQLDSITRLGRALGVSLILAAQQPANSVTDQMRANIKFRICLRVENPEDSREVIRTSDAAYLPVGIPGRAYYRIGNELPELIQVAQASIPYLDSDIISEESIVWIEDMEGETPAEAVPEPLTAIIINKMKKYIIDEDIQVLRKEWPDPLPKYLPLSMPIDINYLKLTEFDEQFGAEQNIVKNLLLKNRFDQSTRTVPLNGRVYQWLHQPNATNWISDIWHDEMVLKASLGLIDNPARGRQHVLLANLMQDKHYAIFGASGWGKSTFLQTMIISFAATHAPEDFHVYVLDFAGRKLELFQQLPHVGSVITSTETDRVARLMIILGNMLEERKRAIQGKFVDIIKHNQVEERHFPAILVAVDNFGEFKENYEDLMPILLQLLREGPDMGIYFAVTANLPAGLGSKVYNLFPTKMALTLADPTEYSNIVGRGSPVFSESVGRGVIRVTRDISRAPLEFQLAAPVGLSEKRMDAIEEETRNSRQPLEDIYLNEIENQSIALHRQLFSNMHAYLNKIISEERSEIYQWPKPIDIPNSVDLLKVMRVDNLTELQVEENWQRSRQIGEWPIAVIGAGAGESPTKLTFDAKEDGVHGVVAGTTGSGKSELLMTMIISLAIRYDPSAVNFLLVDFKGGTAFDEFKNLPHCIELVTNLDQRGVRRVFESIKAELDRRGSILANSNKSHIVDYRRAGLHKENPLPHLFIIIDEFAEMIQDNVEYKNQLESITRLGRALGVSLILAAQRPSGKISDQMRSNMKFRICLRVENPEDSREMLRRPDAANLPNNIPGRAYLQVGNSIPELIQVALSAADFKWTEADRKIENLLKFSPDGQPLDEGEIGDDTNLLSVLVNYMKRLSETETEVDVQRKTWPDPLPRYLPISEPIPTYYLAKNEQANQIDDKSFLEGLTTREFNPDWLALNEAIYAWENGTGQWLADIWNKPDYIMCASVGLIDHPLKAQQQVAKIDFNRGNMAIFGSGGWGKTTFLKTLILSLAATHSPHDLHIYILDFGGRALQNFVTLPHVGAVIDSEESERLNRLFRYLNSEQDRRQEQLQAAEATDILKYNQQSKQNRLPAILVVISNYDEIKDNLNYLEPQLTSLLREGRRVGIYFTASGAGTTSMRNTIFSMFTNRITLNLPDPNDYREIVGRVNKDLPEIMGRGLIRVDRSISQTALEIQIAAPVSLPVKDVQSLHETYKNQDKNTLQERLINVLAEKLNILINEQIKRFQRAVQPDMLLPYEIRTLDNYVYYDMTKLDKPDDDGIAVPMGIQDENLETWLFKLDRRPHFVITGQPSSGKTNFLQTLTLGLSVLYTPDEIAIVLIDPRQVLFDYGGKYKFSALPHVVDVISQATQFDSLYNKLSYQFESEYASQDEREWFILIDNYDDLALDIEILPKLATLTREYQRRGLHVIMAKSEAQISNLISRDPWIKQVWQQYRFGLALQREKAIQSLDAKPPRALRDIGELDPGRGYLIQPRTELKLIQIATIFSQENVYEDELDKIIQNIQEKYISTQPIVIATFDGGIPLFDNNEPQMLFDLTDQFVIYNSEVKELPIECQLIYLPDDENEEEYSFQLRIKNRSSLIDNQPPLIFHQGILYIHNHRAGRISILGDDKSLFALAQNPTRTQINSYKGEWVSHIEPMVDIEYESKISPHKPERIYNFKAKNGDALSFILIAEQSNQWLYDLYASVNMTSINLGSRESVETHKRVVLGKNQEATTYKILDGVTFSLVSIDLLEQVEIEFTPESPVNSLRELVQYSEDEIQKWIDQDKILLPTKFKPFYQDIREQRDDRILHSAEMLKYTPLSWLTELPLKLPSSIASLEALREYSLNDIKGLLENKQLVIGDLEDSNLKRNILDYLFMRKLMNPAVLDRIPPETLSILEFEADNLAIPVEQIVSLTGQRIWQLLEDQEITVKNITNPKIIAQLRNALYQNGV